MIMIIMGERRRVYRVLLGNLRERDHLGNPGRGGRIIRKWDVDAWTGSIWLRLGTGGGHL
jgi:hypothetical protein